MLYHATDKKSAIKIWKNGLKSNDIVNNNREHRKKLRKHTDKVAVKNYSNYVPRENAIFAWTNFEDAVDYSVRFYQPAIVEFDINGPAWCVENHISEDLYESYNSDYSDLDIYHYVSNYRPWNNINKRNVEVWFQESSVGSIYRIVDDYGEVLSLD